MERNECRVIDCDKPGLNGQEGYCPGCYDELLRIRKENKEAYDEKTK